MGRCHDVYCPLPDNLVERKGVSCCIRCCTACKLGAVELGVFVLLMCHKALAEAKEVLQSSSKLVSGLNVDIVFLSSRIS